MGGAKRKGLGGKGEGRGVWGGREDGKWREDGRGEVRGWRKEEKKG